MVRHVRFACFGAKDLCDGDITMLQYGQQPDIPLKLLLVVIDLDYAGMIDLPRG